MLLIIPMFSKRTQQKHLIKLLITCGYVFRVEIAKNVNMLYILTMSQTYQPNKKKRASSHGFLVRTKTPGGKKVTQARRRKGRAKVSISK